MKKHGIRHLINTRSLALAGVLAFSGCNDFLDENPDNRVALEDLENAAQVLVNGYSDSSPNFTDWMTDDVVFTTGTTIRTSHRQIFNWEEVTTGPTEQDTPDHYWFAAYEAISHANEVLSILDALPANSEEELARKQAIEGEARLIRAYHHFMLVNMFSQHYDEDDASTDLGIPYVKEPETTFLASYERLSVEETYDEIEDDLLRGLDLVDDTFFENSGKYHFNRNAALAFASRFYLFKREFRTSLQYSNELLGNNPDAFIKDLTSEEFLLARSSVIEYPRLYTSPDQAGNLLLMRKISLVQRPDFAFGPGRDDYGDLFGFTPFGGLTDMRENPAFVKGFESLLPARYENLFQRLNLNSNVGFPYYIHIAFSGEEVLLNRAEANAWLGNLDGAIADMQVLANRRFTGGDPELDLETIQNFIGSRNAQNDVLSYIVLLERRKEFIMQGMRWWDIKRYDLRVQRTTGAVLESEDLRKVMQIPTSAVDVGGLEPNPR